MSSSHKGGCGSNDCTAKKDSQTPILFEESVALSAGGIVTTVLTPEFPIGKTIRFGVLAARILVAPVGAATFTLQVYRNGTAVPGASVTFTSADTAPATKRVSFSQRFSVGDTLSLVAVQDGVFAGATAVAATLTPKS